jgi:hypothetical protein
MGIDLTGGGFGPYIPGITQPSEAQVEEAEEFGAYGDPMDRRWPGTGFSSFTHDMKPIRPTDVSDWFDMTDEQRWTTIMNAYILMNDALIQGDMSQVEDDTFIILGWGANDKNAQAAGAELLGEEGIKLFVGEGYNPKTGMPLLNDLDSSPSERWNPFGTDEPRGYVDRMAKLINDTMEGEQGWWRRNFATPGEVSLFSAAANGGNMTTNEQKWAHRGQMAADALAFAAGAQIVGGAVVAPRFAAGQWKVSQMLKPANLTRLVTSPNARRFHGTMLAGSVANWSYSMALGYINDVETELYEPIREMVENGEMGGDEATLIIQSTHSLNQSEGISRVIPPSITDSEWWNPAIAPDAPLETYDEAGQGGAPGEEASVVDVGEEGDEPFGVARSLFEVARQAWDAVAEPQFEATGLFGDTGGTSGTGYALDDYDEAAGRVGAELYENQTPEREAQQAKEAREAELLERGNVIGGLAPNTRVSPTVTELQPWHPGNFQRNDPVAQEMADTYAPRYFDENYRNIIGGWSIDETEWFQNQAILAGLIDPESYIRYGSRDGYTTTAFMQILTDANNNGNMWKDELGSQVESYQQWKMDNPEKKDSYPAFITPAYPKPDYATLSQQVKGAVGQSLGRRATASELQLLTDHLGQLDRQEWSGQVSAQRAEHAARGREYDDRQDDGISTGQSAGTVQQVDAESRFNEFFEEKYQGELSHRARVGQVQDKQAGLFQSLSRIAGNI